MPQEPTRPISESAFIQIMRGGGWVVAATLALGHVLWRWVAVAPRAPECVDTRTHLDAATAVAGPARPAPDAAAKPALLCPPGRADCNADPGDACEAALESDARNCGACGADCQGGACAAGVCQAIAVASGQRHASGVAVDDDAVYYTENATPGGVFRLSRAGGAPQALVEGVNAPDAIAVDGDRVYWATGAGEIMSVAKAGGSPKTLATRQDAPSAVAARDGVVYWTSLGASGAVMKLKAGDAEPERVVANVNRPCGVAVDARYVYFTSYGAGTISRVPLEGGDASVLAGGQSFPCAIAVNGAGVYWLNFGSSPAVMRAPLEGGAASILSAESGSVPVALAVDETRVYWTSNQKGGAVLAMPAAGGALTPLAVALGNVAGVGVARSGVLFFANYGAGSISKIVARGPKPPTDHAAMNMAAMHAHMAEPGGSGEPASPQPPILSADGAEITLNIASVGNTMAFDLTAMTVKTGQRVHLVFKNVATLGVLGHNWVLVKPGSEASVAERGLAAGEKVGYVAPGDGDVLAGTPLAAPGETVDVTFTAPAPGTYPYVCTMPGHYVVMKGKLTVVQ